MTDGTTTFINASACTVNFLPMNPPIVFDLPNPRTTWLQASHLQSPTISKEKEMKRGRWGSRQKGPNPVNIAQMCVYHVQHTSGESDREAEWGKEDAPSHRCVLSFLHLSMDFKREETRVNGRTVKCKRIDDSSNPLLLHWQSDAALRKDQCLV